MTQEKKNVKEIEHTIGVRIDCSRFLQIVELKCSIDFEETGKAENRNRAELDLKNIQRRQREKIDEKSRRVQVIHGEFVMIVDEETYASQRHDPISKRIRVRSVPYLVRDNPFETESQYQEDRTHRQRNRSPPRCRHSRVAMGQRLDGQWKTRDCTE